MTTVLVNEAIKEFEAAVRAALNDLTPEEVDDLTEGLEADLVEQERDAGESFTLGDPLAYAAELRAAAGLPERDITSIRTPVLILIREGRLALTRRIRATGAGSAALDFVLVLRPVWWVLRGWSLYLMAAYFLPGSFGYVLPWSAVSWVLLAAFLVLSVQWGRGRWLPRTWMRGVKIIASVFAILGLPFQFGSALSAVSAQYWQTQSFDLPGGLWMNGGQVTNIFPYDAEGNPLSGVQLFTQDGKPLFTVYESGSQGEWIGNSPDGTEMYLVPNPRAVKDGWGVYPLGVLSYYPGYSQAVIDPDDIRPAEAPFIMVRPLIPNAPEWPDEDGLDAGTDAAPGSKAGHGDGDH